jgi:MFS family permease
LKALPSALPLLFSTALLLTGHGMQLTLLPLRASATGMTELLIGLSASAYFLGFVAGCLASPLLIARVGHIRVFAVLAATLLTAILCLELVDLWQAWLLLRFLTGAAICGLYTIIESWLNSQVDANARGRLLSIYTFITLTAMTGGQFLINVGPATSPTPFIVAAICMALAILPVGLTRQSAPQPVSRTHSSFALLFARSRSAFAGALLSGVVAGSFWSLGAVYARNYAQSQFEITLFMSAAIAGGAIVQYPVGWMSDRIDRRRVLVALTAAGILTSVGVALSSGKPWALPAIFLFGACAMPLYALSLATAADVCESDEFVTIGTSVLLLNALGAVFAPLLIGQLMTHLAAAALFWSSAALCAIFGGYLLLQLRTPRAVPVSDQTPFEVAATEAAPVAFEMDPRTIDELAPSGAQQEATD